MMRPNDKTKFSGRGGTWMLFRCTCCGQAVWLNFYDNVLRGTEMDGELHLGDGDGLDFALCGLEHIYDLGNIPGMSPGEDHQEGLEVWWTKEEHCNGRNCRAQRKKHSHLPETQGWVKGNMIRHHSRSQVTNNGVPYDGGADGCEYQSKHEDFDCAG